MLQEKIHYNTALYSNEGRVIVITNSYSNEHLKLWGECSTLFHLLKLNITPPWYYSTLKSILFELH